MAEAGEDQILVSQDLAEVLPESAERLSDAGSHELKGVPGSWHLFAIDS